MRSSLGRRVLLVGVALAFAILAVRALVLPAVAPFGAPITAVDALSEYRAIYVGLWLAHAVLFAVAAWRVELALLGDLAALLLFGQAAGRAVSLLMDGTPSHAVWFFWGLELFGSLAVALVRPATSSPR